MLKNGQTNLAMRTAKIKVENKMKKDEKTNGNLHITEPLLTV